MNSSEPHAWGLPVVGTGLSREVAGTRTTQWGRGHPIRHITDSHDHLSPKVVT